MQDTQPFQPTAPGVLRDVRRHTLLNQSVDRSCNERSNERHNVDTCRVPFCRRCRESSNNNITLKDE